jgi:hypothetical protein
VWVYPAWLRRVRVLIPAFVLVGLWGWGPDGSAFWFERCAGS